MLQYERRAGGFDAAQLVKVAGPLDLPLLFNPGQVCFCTEGDDPCSQEAPMRGGILCEEMGVGKTLEVLGLCLL